MQAISRELIERFPIAGLCHVTLGSFRILPRYDRLGVPYTVGPLGGGECAPFSITRQRLTPLADKITETVRPVLNNSFALVPPLRTCLRSAALVLNTSRENGGRGAKDGRAPHRRGFSGCLYESGRCGKGEGPTCLPSRQGEGAHPPDLAGAHVLVERPGHRAGGRGAPRSMRASGSSSASSPTGIPATAAGWKSSCGRWKLPTRWNLWPERNATSSCSSWVNTMACSRPACTIRAAFRSSRRRRSGCHASRLGLGGHGLAACPEAGVSESPYRIADFVAKSVACLKRWQDDPATWLEESGKAVEFSTQFTIDRLADDVGRLIVPCFAGNSKAGRTNEG